MVRYAKRGRPRLPREEKDFGTPELQEKRRSGLTVEPLDRCLKFGMISDDEHRAGLHLRWLYTLVFGAPTVRSVEFDRVAGARSHTEHDEAWKARRAREYNHAIEGLTERGAKRLVLDVCIFHRMPEFLRYEGRRGYTEQQRFRDGMRFLAELWRR